MTGPAATVQPADWEAVALWSLAKTTEKCNTIETTEIVQEEVVDHVQAVELIDKDGQRYIKLDDGRLMLVGETIEYTIEDQGHSKVFITE